MDNSAIAQLSVEPPSTCSGVISTLSPSSCTVISWQIATGASSSITFTVTTAVQLAEIPSASVTVRVTMFSPKSAQSKVSISNARVTSAPPVASVEPLLICSGVIVIDPSFAFKSTVIS